MDVAAVFEGMMALPVVGSPAHAGMDPLCCSAPEGGPGNASPARAGKEELGEAIGGVNPGHRPYGPSTRGRNSETSGM